jgi:hypothetical protein
MSIHVFQRKRLGREDYRPYFEGRSSNMGAEHPQRISSANFVIFMLEPGSWGACSRIGQVGADMQQAASCPSHHGS